MPTDTTVAAIATPPGPGGIAVVRISGPQAHAVAARVFRPKNKKKSLENTPGYRALFGNFFFREKALDEGIALCFRAPHSYTGEDVVELSCHGGEVVSRHLLLACLEAGAGAAGPGEFTRRALLNGRLSLTQAEAVMELIGSASRRGVALAHAGLQGELAQRVDVLKRKLLALMAHIAAWTDYPEEDVEPVVAAEIEETMADAAQTLAGWVRGYEQGSLLRRGVRTAIVGSPNVGKSTLFNRMSGFDRAIVTPVAGTTRDVLREQILVGDVPLLLSDTAGLHEAGDIVEKEGIRRSLQEMEEAEFIIAVFDGSSALSADGLVLARRCQGQRALAVINKSDLGLVLETEALQPYFARVLVVSAHDASTRSQMEQAVVEMLGTEALPEDGALLANSRQLAAATRAREAVDAATRAVQTGITLDAVGVCLEDALVALAELAGENVTEQVLEEVFSQFCVGK